MISTFTGGIFGTSVPSESEVLGLKILKKKDFRYIDPMASLVGLAQIAALPKGQDPKISLGVGRLFPKSKEAATKEWLPVCLQAKGMPNFIQSMVHSLDRTWNHDSREYLAFFNFAIPYMEMLHPSDSIDAEQNAIMKEFWGLVNEGIEVLEDSYDHELKKPLIQEENVEPNETQFALKLETTIGKTFAAWKYAIRGYVSQKQVVPRFMNLIGNSENASVEKNKEVKGEEAEKSIVEPILKEFREKLTAALKLKPSGEEKAILYDLRHAVDSSISNGFFSKKLYPLSSKVRLEWTLKDIVNVTNTIKEIRLCTNDVNRESDLLRLGEFLNGKAIKYMEAVDKELDEVMTL